MEYEICSQCNGSGEGQYDGSTCPVCNGDGEVPVYNDDDVEGDDEL